MNPDETDRYSRHLTLPSVGEAGQQKLLASHALIVGMGGLGSPVAMYLAGAGVGQLTFADFDTVEVSNLQRQIAHTTQRVGELKVASAKAQCLAINPNIVINEINYALEAEELNEIIPTCDVVLDCSDNFPTRFAVNKACVQNKVPLVSGAAIRFDGQLTVIRPGQANTPCYRCLYNSNTEAAETCAQAGVLGPVVGMIGCAQAIEAIKVLCDIGETLTGRLVLFDGLNMEWTEIRLSKSPDCPVCGPEAAIV
ncbi:MAG: molybdopterin-synthase adenylyltransferase MoeB [Granulosicoccaceae bacterium]